MTLRDHTSLDAFSGHQSAALSITSRLWKSLLNRVLTRLNGGALLVILPNGQALPYGHATPEHPAITVRINRIRFLRRLLAGNSLALAEGYLENDWECSDLRGLFDLFIASPRIMQGITQRGLGYRILARLRHLANANTLTGSRRNIAYHYDLGNEFYEHWLDKTMTYSSAYKLEDHEPLEHAQHRKYQRVLDLTNPTAQSSILEIGCGWGGFAEHATKAGHTVHGLTLSQEQLRFAQNRLAAASTPGNASFELRDYRHAEGQYDAIVSIEMIEAVGEENWDTYFQQIKQNLKPGGTAVIQAILINDQRFETYRKNVDFIQRYIFPGGLLPSTEKLAHHIKEQGLELASHELFGTDYEKTLMRWRKSFFQKWPEISKLGYDQRFKRMWHYYLAYCEAGFAEGTINVGLFQIKKPASA